MSTMIALDSLVTLAARGDKTAANDLAKALADDVYSLALRMLGRPAAAEDATQESLLSILAELPSFRGESAFRTWAFRVAFRRILRTRRRSAARELTFELLGGDLEAALATTPPDGLEDRPDHAMLVEEVKLGCTQAMLQCLDQEHRAAYVLGEVFELESEDAASLLEIPPATYRKRLQRARERVRGFMRSSCGLASSDAACTCAKHLPYALDRGRVDPENLTYGAQRTRRSLTLLHAVREMESLHDAASAVFRESLRAEAPNTLLARVSELVRSDRYPTVLGDLRLAP